MLNVVASNLTTVAICKSLKLIPLSVQRISSRQNSDLKFLQNTNPAHLKAGDEGRQAFNGKVVTVFGATSFVGYHVVSHLAKIGTQIVVPYREDYKSKQLRIMGDLGQIVFSELAVTDDKSIRMAMLYSDVVINLIGRHYNFNGLFEKINVRLARKLARIAKELNVPQYIHMSALNCNLKHEGYLKKSGSEFLRSKYRGEIAVKEEFPEATIFRPSDIFGSRDSFFSALLSEYRYSGQTIPIVNMGKGIYKQPVSVFNIAQGIQYCVLNPTTTKGITYEAVGPHRYEFCDLLDYANRVTRRIENNFTFVEFKWNLRSRLKYLLVDLSPIRIFSRDIYNSDRLEREFVSDITCGLPDLLDLDIRLIPLEEIAEVFLKPFRYRRWNTQGLMDTTLQTPAKFKSMYA